MCSIPGNEIKGWVNNCEAGDLRRNRAHYDVIVMDGQTIATAVYMYLFGFNSSRPGDAYMCQ